MFAAAAAAPPQRRCSARIRERAQV
jgi:hypothetical protein